MAIVKVEIRPEEKAAIMKAVKLANEEVSSIAKLAASVGLNPNRSRFIMEELIAEGKVEKIIHKKYNNNYVRYRYKLTGKK